MSKYTVKVGKKVHKFDGINAAIAFAQKESWDKARPMQVVKPDGQSIDINIVSK